MKQKNMREDQHSKRKIFVHPLQIVYAIIIVVAILITSCEIPVIEIQSIIPEIVEEPEVIEEIIEVIEEPETVINEEIIEMIMKQIKVYEKYAVTDDNRVLGINGKELEPVFLIDSDDKGYQFNDFYRKNDKLFFSTIIMENGTEKIPDSDPVAYVQVPKTHYYVQTGNSLEETEEGLYPLLPESDFIEMGITPWSIVTFDYVNPKTKEKITTSRVVKSIYDEDGKWVKDSPTGFKMIDAYFVVNDGLWFSVPEDIGIRKKGIYFYPLVGNLKSTPVMSGKIW